MMFHLWVWAKHCSPTNGKIRPLFREGGAGALATVRRSCQGWLAQVNQISKSWKSLAGILREPAVLAGSCSRVALGDGA